MSNLQLWGGGLTVVGLSPVLTSGAIIDDADSTHTPCWGRVFSVSAQQMGLLRSSLRVMLWIITAMWHRNVHPSPSYMPTRKNNTNKKGRVSLWGFPSGKFNLDISGCMCSLFKNSTEIPGDPGASRIGVVGELVLIPMVALGDPIVWFPEVRTPSFDYTYSLLPA